ncbi:HNH endonuclease signature motif containing protein [Demequina rhizosphaerae]|uniref:HNH endonuclease signature motif containing protein n=1 Tax=Demequina rhizosphaerae TaxID=1638985 RepID=UPI000781E53A|nr:HNH endonuclease signature motif containing protein [Demequina rhizosphaerae]
MTFSAARLTTALAALRHFDGVDLDALAEEEFGLFQECVASVYRHAGVAAADAAAAVQRRSARERGANGWARRHGHANARGKVAEDLGIGEGEAQKLIDAGDSAKKERYPLIAAAHEEGRIGAAAVAVLTDTLDAIAATAEIPDGLEARLVAKAERLSLRDLRRACEQLRARLDREALAAKERRHREQRALVISRDADGMTRLSARLDVASAAPIVAWLDAQLKDAFQRRQDDPVLAQADRRTAVQVRVDALAMLAQHGLGCNEPGSGVRTEVIVRVNTADLEDDLALGSCDSLPGPITVGTMRLMAVDARILPVVMGGDSVPLDWGRARRLYTADQRKALMERDGGCAWCLAPPTWCIVHHRRYWGRDGGRTDLKDGVPLCTGCHVRLHTTDWELEMRDGRPWFIPPATIDPTRTPIQGGIARLHIDLDEQDAA